MEQVAKLTIERAEQLAKEQPHVDIVVDLYGKHVIDKGEAQAHLKASEYELINWAPSGIGSPRPVNKHPKK